MTHLLPPHADLNLAHSSLQTALQIDPNQQPPPTPQQQQQPPQQQQPTGNTDYLMCLGLGKGGALMRVMEFNHLFSVPWQEVSFYLNPS